MIPTKKQVLEYSKLNKKIFDFSEMFLSYLSEISGIYAETDSVHLSEEKELCIVCSSSWFDEVYLPINDLKSWKKYAKDIVQKDKEREEKNRLYNLEQYKQNRYEQYLELKKEFENEGTK